MASGSGTGKGTLAVTEEFTLHQVFGDGATVDRNEGATTARTAGVDQASSEFLAATRFPGDIDGRLTARQFLDQRPHLQHRRRFAG